MRNVAATGASEIKLRFMWRAGKLIKSAWIPRSSRMRPGFNNLRLGVRIVFIPGRWCRQQTFSLVAMFNWDCNLRPRPQTTISSIALNLQVHEYPPMLRTPAPQRNWASQITWEIPAAVRFGIHGRLRHQDG